MSIRQWSPNRLHWGARPACILLLVVSLTVCGCNKSRSTTSGDAVDATAADSKSEKKQIIPVRRDVKELEGNWVMVVTVQGRDNYLWIMRITKGSDGTSKCEMLDTSNDKFEPVIASSEIKDKSLSLKLKNKMTMAQDPSMTIDYEGEFDGIAIRGTLYNGPQEMYIGRLLPTDAGKLTDYVVSALPPAADVFQKAITAMNNRPQPKVILKLAREHSTSPIALEAVFGLLSLQSRAGFDDATILEIIEQYVKMAKLWGPRMQAQAELVVAQQLVTTGRMPTETLKHLDQLDQLLGEREEALKPAIKLIREQAEIQAALAKSKSKLDEDRAAAHVELQEGLKKQPYNAEILLALAEYSEATKQVDAAIDYYSTMVALPLLEQFVLARRAGQPAGDPTPSDKLKEFWIEKHGNEDGLKPRLTEIYQERITGIRNEIRKAGPVVPTEVGDHIVLVEFFTGGQMPPAVGSEIAMDALRETYQEANIKVITLRYHQHLPGADGLVNQDSEDRFAYYEMGKVPGLALDGAALDPDKTSLGGFLQHSGNAYSMLRIIVDPRIKKSTPIRIELDGKIENEDLAINAAVTGATEEELPSLRLRLALAEEMIEAALPNGIRHHAMVVREMPGGARGIAPKKGELKFSYTMPAGDIQQHLNDYLKLYEEGKKIEIPAEAKPPVRGPLHLVAWVQNDKVDTQHPEVGRAILQSAIVPVTGKLPEPPATEVSPAKPKAESDSDSATPPASAKKPNE